MAAVKKPKKLSRVEERNDGARRFLLGDQPPQLEDMNEGELLAICAHIGERAHRGLPRQKLIEIVEGLSTYEQANPVDKMRDRLKAFLQLYWSQIKNQLAAQCSGDCYRCSDMKVLACYHENRSLLFKP